VAASLQVVSPEGDVEVITKSGKGYQVKSESGKNLSKKGLSKKAAKKRLAQVEYFKHKDSYGRAKTKKKAKGFGKGLP